MAGNYNEDELSIMSLSPANFSAHNESTYKGDPRELFINDFLRYLFKVLFLVFGFPGNLLSIVTFFLLRSRLSTYCWLRALSIINFLITIFYIIIAFIKPHTYEQTYSLHMILCVLFVIQGSLTDWSSIVIAFLSLEQFISIYFPLKGRLIIHQHKRLRFLLPILLIVCLPTAVSKMPYYIKAFFLPNNKEDEIWNIVNIINTVRIIAFRLIPIAMIFTFNCASAKRYKSVLRKRSLITNDYRGNNAEERSIMRLLIVTATLFSLSTLPKALYHVICQGIKCKYNETLDLAMTSLDVMYFTINFHIYFIFCQSFRKTILSKFKAFNLFTFSKDSSTDPSNDAEAQQTLRTLQTVSKSNN